MGGAVPARSVTLSRADAAHADVGAAALGLGGDWQGNKYQVKPCPPGFDALNDTLDDQAYRSLRTYPDDVAAQRSHPASRTTLVALVR